jgi:hypothetical protein
MRPPGHAAGSPLGEGGLSTGSGSSARTQRRPGHQRGGSVDPCRGAAAPRWIASSNRRFWKLSAGHKVAPIRRLPTVVRVPMLRRCSSSPRQMPQRSVPPSSRAASWRLRSNCAGCSPASRTTCRPGSALGPSPGGSRYRRYRPGCTGAGSPETVPRDAGRHPRDLTIAGGGRPWLVAC